MSQQFAMLLALLMLADIDSIDAAKKQIQWLLVFAPFVYIVAFLWNYVCYRRLSRRSSWFILIGLLGFVGIPLIFTIYLVWQTYLLGLMIDDIQKR
jgi:hypothetical protein